MTDAPISRDERRMAQEILRRLQATKGELVERQVALLAEVERYGGIDAAPADLFDILATVSDKIDEIDRSMADLAAQLGLIPDPVDNADPALH